MLTNRIPAYRVRPSWPVISCRVITLAQPIAGETIRTSTRGVDVIFGCREWQVRGSETRGLSA